MRTPTIEPRIVPAMPMTKASLITSEAIWPREPPMARRMPSCRRRWVTLIRNVLVMTKTATSRMKARAMRRAWFVERIVSSAIALRLAGWRSSALAGSCFSIALATAASSASLSKTIWIVSSLSVARNHSLSARERDEQAGALARHRRRAGGEQADDFDADAAAAGEELDLVADFDAEIFGEELAEEGALGVGEGLAFDDLVFVDLHVALGIDGGGDELDAILLC